MVASYALGVTPRRAPAKKSRSFEAHLRAETGERSVVYFLVPFSVKEAFGISGGCPVRGTINGCSFKSHLYARKGSHYMLVSKELRAKAGVEAGKSVSVEMRPEPAPRPLALPGPFARALAASHKAKTAWDGLGRKERKAILRALEVKTPAVLARKVAAALALLEKESA